MILQKYFLLIFSAVIIIFSSHHSGCAEEGDHSFTGSMGGEIWYTNWNSKSGLESVGAELVYEIEPAMVWGYSACVHYKKNSELKTGLFLDLLLSQMKEMEKKINKEAFQNRKRDLDIYREIKAKLIHRLWKNWYYYMKLMYGNFDGNLTIYQGGDIFSIPNGTTWNMDSDWFKADVLLATSIGPHLLGGFGYKYISYNKPQAFFDFYGTVTGDELGSIKADSLIAGQIVETDIDGHHLMLGIWNKGYLGIAHESLFFGDLTFYIGNVCAKSSVFEIKNKTSAGLEGKAGLKYSYSISERASVTCGIGYRLLHHVVAIGEKKGLHTDGKSIYQGTRTVDTWHGPFLYIAGYF
jgi:hypothetical protein